ncbi:hypothetical protein BO94DRAFT_531009 [Aspergillus sclerotioniger CBS 115572]|uniref:Uncharacterized protein n=1 Tax=Aspergillus sclerotioniger CBS 115572 TaxID=1450535 RepID=A0A317X969_9EURO|nr:hypothetical protein BO94DRAFT_531009 [Aspergillus sclerotioniger CBS 115572]PWY95106.1 hypothetical protein BO94DRAFT_531009 [Aspergillus sclerotioniger CBS 115572]
MPHKDEPTSTNTSDRVSDSVNRLAATGTNITGAVFGSGMDQNTSTIPDYLSTGAEDDRPLSKEEADRLYEERMEEEYAKREGGA